jgi:hypothetical protein
MFELASLVDSLPNLKLRGLMTIPSAGEGPRLEAELSHMQRLFAELKLKFPQVDTLSMGMSQDLELAIAKGSTMVRVGSAIFGERNYG